jgi:XTP/dITP diphosphohydrolase
VDSEPVRWIVATSNPHKLRELATLFDGAPVTLEPLPAGVVLPEETGTSFLVNARLKARAVAKATGRVALADDSGLEVDALGGEPGIRSARFAGVSANDLDNNRLLLEHLRGIHGVNRRARFRCVLVLASADGSEVSAEGRIEGFVRTAPSGQGGFGYDPLFTPEGDDRSLAEYTEDEKNAVSHRGRAARKILEALARLGRLTP